MKELRKKYCEVLERLGWKVSYGQDGTVEIENFSPAGENLVFCFPVKGFPEAVSDYADEFDMDEHIAMWIEAKQHGMSGVPSTRELVHDAEDIDKMLQELAAALAEVTV